MADHNRPVRWQHSEPEPKQDEGGLRAPPELKGWRKAWWWFDFIVLVKLARLRFIAILLVIGVVITQWDRLVAYYDKWTRPASAADVASSDVEYFCPMHPSVIRDNPKEKCPICFMPLSKRKKGEAQTEALPAGVVNRVQLSPYRVVLAGVQTWPVDYQSLSKEITAVGYVEFNERGQKTVSARVSGRIDKLLVNETGQMVNEGDALASLYSPDLMVTVQALLDARRSKNDQHLQDARTRLELLGIDEKQINEILSQGEANTHLTIRSPITGHVIKKYVLEGQYVEEGSPLYDVADLSTVWIQAQVYEDDMAFLPVQQSHDSPATTTHDVWVTATTRAYPNEEFKGRLSFIYPHADQETRTVTVRFELANPDHKLRPGSTATVTIHVSPEDVPSLAKATEEDSEQAKSLQEGKLLAVPESAVIDTGSQQIIYREASPNVYEGVLVKLGPRMAGPDGAPLYPVLSGLQRGEKIVTSGSFLVDAETRLNPAAGSIYFGGSGGSKDIASSVTAVRPSTPEDGDAKITAALAKLSPSDRVNAEAQRLCPVLQDSRLGSMGTPIKLVIDGQPVFLCCAGCRKKALAEPAETLKRVEKLKAEPTPSLVVEPLSVKPSASLNEEAEIAVALAELAPDDRKQAEAQRFCVVAEDSRLGSMGAPIKLMIKGQPVFLCCEGCEGEALSDPEATLSRVKTLTEANKKALDK